MLSDLDQEKCEREAAPIGAFPVAANVGREEDVEHLVSATLERFGVRFDTWFSEQTLHETGKVTEALTRLQEAGLTYEQDGALWFRSTTFGDDKDRVIIRSNGEPTYFASDIGYLGQKFYTVKVNAEGRNDISWNGKTYAFNKDYKAHDFAIYLTNGQLSYPTTVVIPVDGEPQAIPGYLAPDEFELIAKYFGEGNFGKVAFDEYQKKFKSSW